MYYKKKFIMEKIDVFDWDKTLYKKDSTIEFYKFCIKKKKTIINYLPVQIVFFLLYKLKLVKKIICKEVGINKLIASKVDKYSGKFSSENCYGKEKVNRLNKEM